MELNMVLKIVSNTALNAVLSKCSIKISMKNFKLDFSIFSSGNGSLKWLIINFRF